MTLHLKVTHKFIIHRRNLLKLITLIYNSYRNRTRRRTKEERASIKGLTENENIILKKSDKGGGG